MNRNSRSSEQHWLYRRENHKKLWWLFGIILAATVVVQVAIHVHGHFGFDEWFGAVAFLGSAVALSGGVVRLLQRLRQSACDSTAAGIF